MKISRRQLLRGPGKAPQLRPPWLKAPASFTEQCTRCNQCIEHCPEHIIRAGHGGYPSIDFARGECTFCGQCTRSCEADLFDDPHQGNRQPWQQTASIGDHCLTYSGIMCRSCEDACEPGSIQFMPVLGGVAQPKLDQDTCTGCGACIRPCPEQAITIMAGT